MATSHADQNLWQAEQGYVSAQKKERPELFVSAPKGTFDLHDRIGITSHPPTLPKGYIKYSPLDFIVEEITLDGIAVTVDGTHGEHTEPDGAGTVYADMTKVGISTLDAAQRMADALHCPLQKIGYSGIKDALAMTGQRISVRGSDLEAVRGLSVPGVVLSHFMESKGVLAPGQLRGNRFTLTIRTENPLDTAFDAALGAVASRGVMNYYGPQRFGTPRFLAHVFGAHILRGDYAAAVYAYLTLPSPFELPFYANRRAAAAEHFGDWKKMHEMMLELPYAFRQERVMLEALMQSNGSHVKAISSLEQQAKMWVQAYTSYLINLTLSEAESNDAPLPDMIPLPLSESPEPPAMYRELLARHGIANHLAALKALPFLTFGRNQQLPSRIRPTVHGHKVVPDGVILSFDLPKGAYATTVLMYLFETVTGMPLPEWIRTTDYDAKRELGTGDLTTIKETLKEALTTSMLNKTEQEE